METLNVACPDLSDIAIHKKWRVEFIDISPELFNV